MNLIMTCTPIGRSAEQFRIDQHYASCAGNAFLKLYPNGKVFLGTTNASEINNQNINTKFFILSFDFEKYPFALSRQIFYREFCRSSFFSEDTAFVGLDVLFTKKIPELPRTAKLAITYRNHPSQPYCSDLLIFRLSHKEYAVKFQSEIIEKIQWMPREIQAGAADQLALALQIGILNKNEYNGSIKKSPRDKNILLLPSDDFLFTPNDYFSSNHKHLVGSQLKNTESRDDILNLIRSKWSIHLKGNRKHLIEPFFEAISSD
jgi:hypothetical protein